MGPLQFAPMSFVSLKKIKTSRIFKALLAIFALVNLCVILLFAHHLDKIDDSNRVTPVLSPSISINAVTNQTLKEVKAFSIPSKPVRKKIEIAPNKVTLRSLGIPQKLHSTKFDHLRKNTGVTVIISYCEETLEWIYNYIGFGRYKIKEILIYSKCSKNVKGLEIIAQLAPTKVIDLPNVGRCDHTYASWIHQNYQTLEEEYDTIDGQDIVLFIKDNDYHKDSFYTFEQLFTFAAVEGFGCAEKPVCDCKSEQCDVKKDIALLFHDPKKLDQFRMNTHNRLERDMKQPFKSKKYKKLKDWKDSMQFVIPKSKVLPVCYGGIFAAKKRHMLNQPKDVWERMVKSLARGDNIIEGHFAERLWAPILSYNDTQYMNVVSKAVLQRVHDTFSCWNRKGMMMVPRSKGYNISLSSIE